MLQVQDVPRFLRARHGTTLVARRGKVVYFRHFEWENTKALQHIGGLSCIRRSRAADDAMRAALPRRAHRSHRHHRTPAASTRARQASLS